MVEVFLTQEVTHNSFTGLDPNLSGFMASRMVVLTNQRVLSEALDFFFFY